MQLFIFVRLQPRVLGLLGTLQSNRINKRQALIDKWSADKNFLLLEYLQFLPKSYWVDLTATWPPILILMSDQFKRGRGFRESRGGNNRGRDSRGRGQGNPSQGGGYHQNRGGSRGGGGQGGYRDNRSGGGYQDRSGGRGTYGPRGGAGYHQRGDYGRGGYRPGRAPTQLDFSSLSEIFAKMSINSPTSSPFYYTPDKYDLKSVVECKNIVLPSPKLQQHCIADPNKLLLTNYFQLASITPFKAYQFDITFKVIRSKGGGKDKTTATCGTSAELEEHSSIVEGVKKSGDYNVDMFNKTTRRRLVLIFIDKLSKHTGISKRKFIYDGAHALYSCVDISKLIDGGCEFAETVPYRDGSCDIQMKYDTTHHLDFLMKYLQAHLKADAKHVTLTGNGDQSSNDIMQQVSSEKSRFQGMFQVLDVLLRHSLTERFECYGRSYYVVSPPELGIPLPDNLRLFKGFFTNFRFFYANLAVNLDVSNSVFRCEQSVQDFLISNGYDMKQWQYFDKSTKDKINRLLKDVKVKLNHLKYVRYMKIDSVNYASPAVYKFNKDKTGSHPQMVSVQEYFRMTYKMEVDIDLPLISARKGEAMLPFEVCTIPTSRVTGVLPENVTRDMIKQTALKPPDRMAIIKQKFAEFLPNGDDPYLKEWGISIKNEMSRVNYSVLQHPQLYTRDGTPVSNFTIGAYSFRNSYYQPPPGTADLIYAVLNLSSLYEDVVDSFLGNLCQDARKYGIRLVQGAHNIKCVPSVVLESLEKICTPQETRPSIIFVIISGTTEVYGTVKSVAELSFGVMTQCLKEFTLKKSSPTLNGNIIHKLNAKLGGINVSLIPRSTIDTFQPERGLLGDTMLVGIDVTHGGGSSRLSIAAVVASMDFHPHLYELRLSGQKHPKAARQSIETIVDMHSIMCQLLKSYYNKHNKPPLHLIIYRDGVSEGQFDIVMNYEYNAIDRAINKMVGYLNKNIGIFKKPLVTYCVVQKRHHTRFFPIGGQTTRSGNILPGTVVDAGICLNTEFDFFLCSHEGIQGTSRPTYYRILLDQNNLSRQTMAQLSYNLCFTFARCTRSVSMPAPVYYAHLAAFRARHYVDFFSKIDTEFAEFMMDSNNNNNGNKDMSDNNGGNKETDSPSVSVVSILVKQEVANLMFFV
ncbi:hypothetical protein GJ496_001236 [Pomphorhynchus laevis]|nr:hypothetical protein GJ496_001236 [Pomphorhynchus laevis]